MRAVNIGGPIALGVIGAILYFAMSEMIQGVDTRMIGLILMVAAAIWLVLGLFVARPRTRVTTERTDVHGVGGAGGPQDRVAEREVRQDDI